ncbi:MAG: hypothetical protein ACKVPX_06795 [Myxococcaceae bacterium]
MTANLAAQAFHQICGVAYAKRNHNAQALKARGQRLKALLKEYRHGIEARSRWMSRVALMTGHIPRRLESLVTQEQLDAEVAARPGYSARIIDAAAALFHELELHQARNLPIEICIAPKGKHWLSLPGFAPEEWLQLNTEENRRSVGFNFSNHRRHFVGLNGQEVYRGSLTLAHEMYHALQVLSMPHEQNAAARIEKRAREFGDEALDLYSQCPGERFPALGEAFEGLRGRDVFRWLRKVHRDDYGLLKRLTGREGPTEHTSPGLPRAVRRKQPIVAR